MSNRYRGGIISATKPTTDGTPYTGAAGGVWNLVQHARQKQLNLWPKGQGVSAPMDPTVTSIVPGNKNLTITFTEPTDTGNLPITNYTATIQPGNLVIDSPVPNITAFDLTNNTRYSVTVSATNSYGTSTKNSTYTSDIDQDEYVNNNILFLEFDGDNKSIIFLDISPKLQNVTRVGNPHISTENSKYGNSSLYLNGSSYLYYTLPFSAISSTTTPFTIDFWYYPTSLTVNSGVCVLGINNAADGADVLTLGLSYYVSGALVVGTLPINLNSWNHIAISSTGASTALYINGSQYTSTSVPTTALSSCTLCIGAQFNGANGSSPANYAVGYVDRFRVTSGVARFTTNFTPGVHINSTTSAFLTIPSISTSAIGIDPYTSSNVLFLDFEGANTSQTFTDSSTARQTASIVGNPYLTNTFKKFGDTCLYLDGSSAYLYYSSPFNSITSTTTPFTIDFWYYPTSLTVNAGVCVLGINSKAGGANVLLVGKDYWVSDSTVASNIAISLNTWNHIAISSTGTTMVLYINGVAAYITSPPSTALSNCVLGIGAEFDGANGGSPGNWAPGYVDRFRVTAGVARYTGNFDPSITQASSLGDQYYNNLSLYVNGESVANSGLGDLSANARSMTLVGTGVTRSTTQTKIGTYSMYFPGTGNLSNPSTAANIIGLNNDFTVEFWMYPTTAQGSWTCILGNYLDAAYGSRSSWGFGYDGGGTLLGCSFMYASGAANGLQYTTALPVGTWTHVSVVRYGSTFTMYINGNSVSTFTYSGAIYDGGSYFELGSLMGGSYRFTGYLDDVRIYRVATHTANFTPPLTPSAPYVSYGVSSTPGAPTNVAATFDTGQSTITFTAPTNNGGSAITSYKVITTPGNTITNTTETSVLILNLVNGVSYTFRVAAVNLSGISEYSAPSNTIQPNPATVPDAPILTSAVFGNTTATITFTKPSNQGGSAISSYTVTSSPDNLTVSGPSSPITLTGLTNGTPYTFTVVATNVTGDSLPSNVSDIVIPATVPGPPIIGEATYDTGQSIVSFTSPASDGGSLITSYTVTSAPGNITATGTSSPITVTGLTNGTFYNFSVAATNKAGKSPSSLYSNYVQPNVATVPSAPTITNAVYGNTTATITFAAPTNYGGSTVTGYAVTSAPGNFTASGSSSPLTVTGLTNGTSYTFTATATNSTGTSSPSAVSGVVVPATVPGAPTIGTASVGVASSSVAFTAPVYNGGSAVTSYTVVSNPGGITSTAAASPITISGLNVDLNYTFTVYATNKAGRGVDSGPSNSVRPALGPGAPTGVTAAYGYSTSSIVSFSPPSSNGGYAITQYQVTSSGGQTATGTSSPITITGLTNGTAYTFTVRASTSFGNGVASSASNSVVVGAPAAPTVTGVTYSGGVTATVAFTAPTLIGGSAITSYTLIRNDGATTSGTTSPISMSNNFTDGVNYSFTVKATNASGTGPASNSSASGNPKLAVTTTYSSASANKVINKSTVTTIANASGWDGTSPVNVTITNNSNIYATSTASAALTFASDIDNLPAGSVVTFVNNGNIGGYKGTATDMNGGLGINVNAYITFYNNGIIAGGGGAGGVGWPGLGQLISTAPAGAYLSSSGWVNGAVGKRNSSGNGAYVGLKYIYKSDAGSDDYGSGRAGGQSSLQGPSPVTEYCSSGGGGGLGSAGGAPGYGSVNVDGSTLDFQYGDASGAGGDAISGAGSYITWGEVGTIYGYY